MSRQPTIAERALSRLGFDHGWTGGQYSIFRCLLGVYLCAQFAMLAPWGPELFSNAGALADASSSPLAYAFPNVLVWLDPPWLVTSVLIAAAAGSLLLALGVRDRIVAVLLWYVWACLFGRNPLISNPALAYVGWMLLLHAALPGIPYGAWSARGRAGRVAAWRLPTSIYAAAWLVLAAGYSYSGFSKLISPSWRDGSALGAVLASPLARPTRLREILLELPELIMQWGTWSVLALELLALPLACIARMRAPLWLALVSLHVGIITTISFTELSLGMLLVHLLTFDPRWIAPLRSRAGCNLHARLKRYAQNPRSACRRSRAFTTGPGCLQRPAMRDEASCARAEQELQPLWETGGESDVQAIVLDSCSLGRCGHRRDARGARARAASPGGSTRRDLSRAAAGAG